MFFILDLGLVTTISRPIIATYHLRSVRKHFNKTFSWYCFLVLFPGIVSWYCFLVLFPGTVSWYCFLVLFPGTVSSTTDIDYALRFIQQRLFCELTLCFRYLVLTTSFFRLKEKVYHCELEMPFFKWNLETRSARADRLYSAKQYMQ